jgi:putative DNA-invertase from lambdoid prophage Rac
MARTLLFARVSTSDQKTENQVREAEMAGFKVETKRMIKKPSAAAWRRSSAPVTRLVRLGRNAMDVRATIDRLAAMEVRVHCLQLGGTDLTSPAGRMVMGVIGAMAEFERDLLIERTQAGLERASSEGVALGRPASLDADQREAVQAELAGGASVSEVVRRYGDKPPNGHARQGQRRACRIAAPYPRALLRDDLPIVPERPDRHYLYSSARLYFVIACKVAPVAACSLLSLVAVSYVVPVRSRHKKAQSAQRRATVGDLGDLLGGRTDMSLTFAV